MVDCYVGEIRLFAGTTVPADWHACDGTLLSISGNEALYTLLGTQYGGNGSVTFGLPDMRGRLPVGQGQGTGLSNRVMATQQGTETVTLLQANLPAHTHALTASGKAGTTATAGPDVTFANIPSPAVLYVDGDKAAAEANAVVSSVKTIGSTGSNVAHQNMMPAVALNYIIALVGIFPTRA